MLENTKVLSEMKEIPFEKIHPNKLNRYPVDNIHSLSVSIANNGLLSPLTVIKKDEDFVILSGGRRYEAIKDIRSNDSEAFKTIPCQVLINGVSEDYERALIEIANYETRDIDKKTAIFELLSAYKAMAENGDMEEKAIAKRCAEQFKLDERTARMYNAVFVKGGAELTDYVTRGEIDLFSASKLSNIKDEEYKKTAIEEIKNAIDSDMSKKDKKVLIADIINNSRPVINKPKPVIESPTASYTDLEDLDEMSFDEFMGDGSFETRASVDTSGVLNSLYSNEPTGNSSYVGGLSGSNKTEMEARRVIEWCNKIKNKDYDILTVEEQNAIEACKEVAERFENIIA